MKDFKEEDSYIFTAENSNEPLKREYFPTSMNKFLKDCALEIDSQPNITSYSFRIGLISQLWRDTSDIEFVRQSLGHAKTTSIYVEDMSESQRQQDMSESQRQEQIKSISSPDE